MEEQTPTAGLTKQLAGKIAALDLSAVPEIGISTVRLGLTDSIGTMIAGSSQPVARLLAQTLAGDGLSEARLIPSMRRAGARTCTLVNGAAAHALDYDDVALDGHPSVVLVPALLAEGEALGSSADDIIRGYIAGYETWAALRKSSQVPLHDRGWHPSGVFGSLGAAAACAALRRLPAEATADTLALAAAQASGLVANFGAMAKPFQAGHAGEAGLLAARLAAAGVSGAKDVLEHDHGYFAAFSGHPAVPLDNGFGHPQWAIATERLDIKNYPMCYSTHRMIDATLELRREHRIDPATIEHIDAHLGRVQIGMLRNHEPVTGLEAKFSAEFAAAAALLAGDVSPREVNDEFVRRPDVRGLMKKVESIPIAEMEAGYLPFSPYDQVVIHLSGGRKLESRRVTRASGSRDNPPTTEQIWKKFSANVSANLDDKVARRLFDELQSFGGRRTLADIFASAGLG